MCQGGKTPSAVCGGPYGLPACRPRGRNQRRICQRTMKKGFDPHSYRWEGVEPAQYAAGNTDGSGRSWRDTTRHIIKGREEGGAFDVRYFEVAPGGFTALECHRHIHSVICLRGEGYAVVGEDVLDVKPFDHVYVAPETPHQFVNAGSQPFGFLCIVDSDRDRPRALTQEELGRLQAHPVTGPRLRL
jgi:quercetin dioxygenase-like cupin family protein